MDATLLQTVIISEPSHSTETWLKKLYRGRKGIEVHYTKTLQDTVNLLKAKPGSILLITDVTVKGQGSQCIRHLKNNIPGVKVIVYVSPMITDLGKYLAYGADGLVSTFAELKELAQVISKVAQTDQTSCCRETDKLLAGQQHRKATGRLLTTRQEQVLVRHMNGMHRPDIGKELGIGVGMVYEYKSQAYDLLKLHGRTAIDYVKEYGLE